ncbi:MAG TPA: T9SS type A sorting domain-containing protein [Candidatus Kapabacteria bacterium]
MRFTLILLLALFAGTVFGQAPVIDSMLIDESKGILSVYGDFGTAQGKVWCDSVELPVLSWGASLVTATIADTGKGSAGGVEVSARGYRSASRVLTAWKAYSHWIGEDSWTTYHWRYDIHSFLKTDKTRSHLVMGGGSIKMKTVFDCAVDSIYCVFVSGLTSRFFASRFYEIETNGNPTWEGYGSTLFAPPRDACLLLMSPNLILPKKDSIVDKSSASFSWNAIEFFSKYKLQLSDSSVFDKELVIDSVVTSLALVVDNLEKNTKYYWRVCGVNTEGESRWSEVWSFTTGISTDVKLERTKSISLACYPNPGTNELTIVTAEPTGLLLYDVTGKIIKSEQTLSNETKWDVSLLPNGTYILGTSSGEMQVVQIVN